MNEDSIIKVPFFRLLLPLLSGILIQYYLDLKYWSIIPLVLGAGIMFLSFFISSGKQYSFRWLFGVGLSLFVIFIGAFITQIKQDEVNFHFSEKAESYQGVILDIPKVKSKSLSCEVMIVNDDKNVNVSKKIICYFQPDGVSEDLMPGDEIRFHGEIQSFKNLGNSDSFDYQGYMYNKGFVGSIYLPVNRWEPTFETNHSLETIALKCRAEILSHFKSLGLSENEFAIVSALTVGYKDALSEDVKESFRATGTAHVLAVSGLHVGIIFAVISFLLGFIHRNSKIYRLKFVIIIILLWVYAFITGLSPSVVRACIMLSIFCIGEIMNRKGFSYNTIFAAAFLILVANPFSLFDVGFQLSFMAVLSIGYLYPKISGLWKLKNKIGSYGWNLFSLSLAAQIGTFPVCLYYFGYFPTYFFVTNVFIPPLVGVIIYLVLAVAIVSIIPVLKDYLLDTVLYILKALIEGMTRIIQFFENLPFAKIEDIKIPLVNVFLLLILIVTITRFIEERKARPLIVSLSIIILLFVIPIPDRIKENEDQLWVMNKREETQIRWNKNNSEFSYTPDSLDSYKYILLRDKRFLSISDNNWNYEEPENKFHIDYLHLAKDEKLSLYALTKIYSVENVILDTSLPSKTTRRLIKECTELNLAYYNVREQGACKIEF